MWSWRADEHSANVVELLQQSRKQKRRNAQFMSHIVLHSSSFCLVSLWHAHVRASVRRRAKLWLEWSHKIYRNCITHKESQTQRVRVRKLVNSINISSMQTTDDAENRKRSFVSLGHSRRRMSAAAVCTVRFPRCKFDSSTWEADGVSTQAWSSMGAKKRSVNWRNNFQLDSFWASFRQ